MTVCGILLQQTNESPGKKALISAKLPFHTGSLYQPFACATDDAPRLYHLVFAHSIMRFSESQEQLHFLDTHTKIKIFVESFSFIFSS